MTISSVWYTISETNKICRRTGHRNGTVVPFFFVLTLKILIKTCLTIDFVGILWYNKSVYIFIIGRKQEKENEIGTQYF